MSFKYQECFSTTPSKNEIFKNQLDYNQFSEDSENSKKGWFLTAYLSDPSGKTFCLWYIAVSAELMRRNSWCLCTHSFDLLIAIIIVLYFLHCQSHWRDRLSKGWHTNLLSVCVCCVSTGDVWTVTIAGSMIGKGQRQCHQRQDKHLEHYKLLHNI